MDKTDNKHEAHQEPQKLGLTYFRSLIAAPRMEIRFDMKYTVCIIISFVISLTMGILSFYPDTDPDLKLAVRLINYVNIAIAIFISYRHIMRPLKAITPLDDEKVRKNDRD